MNHIRKCILLVEDNEKIMQGNKRLLERNGYEIVSAASLLAARTAVKEKKPDAIVLDIMLPDGSGLAFIQELRESKNRGVPVLLLTGLTTQEDIVRGLTEGGDDYLTKPYDFPVLLARIEALIRRAALVPERIYKEHFMLDITAGVAFLDGKDLYLTQKEFSLLLIFIQNPGRFFEAEYLYEKTWNATMSGDNQALKKAIHRLRGKLTGSGWHVAWSRGEGYCFERE